MNRSELKELVKNIMSEESEYQSFFKKALDKAGKSIPAMSDEEKKAFFNKIDAAWDGKGEKNETLVGNQHKLDVDGDGDIEGDDLADLRAGKKADESVNEDVNFKDGKYRFYSKDGVGHLTYNGKEIADGDYDFEGGNAYWMNHSSFGGGQKAFKNGKDVIAYFKKNNIVSESVNEDYDGPAIIKTGNKNSLKVGEKVTLNTNGKKREYKVVKSNGNGDFVVHLVKESVNEGKKVFKVNPGIGKAKYSISSHDGKKKHKDGSDFYDIEIFNNKVDLEKGIKKYTSNGFVKESVNEAGKHKFQIGDYVKFAGDKARVEKVYTARNGKDMYTIGSSKHGTFEIEAEDVDESVNEARTVSNPIKVDSDTMVQIVGDGRQFRELTAAIDRKTGKPIQKFGFDRGNEIADSKEELIAKLQKKYGKSVKFESVNEVKYPTDLKIGSVILGQGFTQLKGVEGGRYYKIVDMDDTTATLVPSDKNGNTKGSTKVRHKIDSIEGGIKTAKRGDANGIVVIKEGVSDKKVDAKLIANKMRKNQSTKAFADKVEKMGKVSHKDLETILPDYVSGGLITNLFKESVNEAKFKSPDYIISTTPASKLPPTRLAHADVSLGLKMAEKLKNYTLDVRHYNLIHANGKVALKLTQQGKTAVRVRTEDDPKYLQLIQNTVNDIVADYVSKIKESVNEAMELPSATLPSAIKSKLMMAIDKIKDSNLTYNQKIQVVGQVMDSLGIDKAEFNKMASKLKGTMESVTEGVSSTDMDKIKGAVEAAKSFMSVGAELKKLGMRYTFATEPLPIYIIQPTPNNKVAIVNKKYATKPDFVVGDIAVGIMESKSPKSVNEGRAFINAARKAKNEGLTEFEFNGKKYPVTIKD
jgi:hypothetical protein